MFKVVIDTNIWISFLIGKTLEDLIDLLFGGLVKILTTDEQTTELIEVVKRPQFKKYFSEEDVEELLFLIHTIAEKVEISEKIDLCRDKKDNFILEIGMNGRADYIVTGDGDLLDLKHLRGTSIIRYREFKELIESLKQRKETSNFN